ncbi:diguanylate cyclase [Dokdonella sp.]|uniref:GGDEF domain-containing protein n=1 Tax=Dokdonella sp. TaxID=2291710 RepID=UPI0035287779
MPKPDSRSRFTRELDQERVRILFANVRFGYLGVLSATVMLYFVAARYASPGWANVWLLAMILGNTPRIIVSIAFAARMKSKAIAHERIRDWERILTLCSAIAYLAFVSVMFLPFGEHGAVAAALCAFVFMIMATGGVLVLSTSLPGILMFLSIVTLAIVVRFILLQDGTFLLFALVFLLGYLQLLRLTIGQHRILVQNIALRIKHGEFALIDPLTGLANRHALYARIDKWMAGAKRSGTPFSLVLIDIDYFKRFNDQGGHNAGDDLLADVAKILQQSAREEDLVVRYGGEEFLIVLPHTEVDGATHIAERIRANVEQQTAVTVSAGVAAYEEGMTFEQFVHHADEALYRAKREGRNRLVVYRGVS